MSAELKTEREQALEDYDSLSEKHYKMYLAARDGGNRPSELDRITDRLAALAKEYDLNVSWSVKEDLRTRSLSLFNF